VPTRRQQLCGEAMSLAHTVTDQEDDVASDGSIFNFCELGAGHEYLSGGM
jgi:hypothetical protein